MPIQSIDSGTVCVTVPKNPHLSYELSAVTEHINRCGPCDVILDFSQVEGITSESISNLLILHKFISEQNRSLVLCNVPLATRSIFTIVELEEVFDFANSKDEALQSLLRTN